MTGRRTKSRRAEASDDTVALVARALVTSGRVVPGLAVEDDGRIRSWWWPVPSASQRALLAGLVADGSADAQRRAASRLAEAVDGMVRKQLAADAVVLVRRRPGRPSVADAWMRSLVSADPWLPPSLDPAKVHALADAVQAWVRSGTVVGGRVRLCLRVHEPVGPDDWMVELLVQDRDEPSLVIPFADVLQGDSPFGSSVIEETLAALGRLARLAPEVAPVLDQAVPTMVALDGDAVVRLLRDRIAPLENTGIGVLLPSWWANRSRRGLRARVKRSSGSVATAAGLCMDAILSFRWEAPSATRS